MLELEHAPDEPQEDHGHGCCGPAPEVTRVAGPAIGLRIHGLDCVDEVSALKHALAGLVEPDQLGFDVLNGRMDVPDHVDVDAVVATVARTGMKAELWEQQAERTWWQRHERNVLTWTSCAALVVAFATHAALEGLPAAIGHGATDAHGAPLAAVLLYTLSIAAGLRLVLPKAWFAARSLRPDMNLLMSFAVAGAIGLGEWFEAATVSFLFALSLLLESWTVGRAKRAVEGLLSLAPSVVSVKRGCGGEVVEVAPDEVQVGEVFLVKPGERVALDGEVVAGSSELDQAPITGESVPVPKELGDEVFAGTINGRGALEVRATQAASDTVLAHIVKLVGEARKDRAEAEVWVERFARVYTPAVLAASVAVMVLPPALGLGTWGDWFYRGLVLLVIGCPCALVIATPVAVVAGLASAAGHGVLVKGGSFLEAPARLKAVALDKTGTLTEGRPVVAEVRPLSCHGPDVLLRTAAAVEAHSEHPIARAVVDHAASLGLPVAPAAAVQGEPGRGASGEVDGQRWWVGSVRWVREKGLANGELDAALEHTHGTVVVVGNDEHACGLILLQDAVRPGARDAVAALRAEGLHVAMLTGDRHGTARAVADAVGIDDVAGELLPGDKLAQVERLERELGPVAMIGDGVNDAPALARASLGVAMGAIGTDVAIETADVALMTDDLDRLAWLVRHAKRTLRIIRQNTVLALSIKALFVVLTLGGFASLWGAIAADMGASLLVVFNALRLLRA